MAYLRGYPGMPELGPGPGACSRVSCSDKAAIYWCNDVCSYPRFLYVLICLRVVESVPYCGARLCIYC